ncbi:MAG: hypothetical protein WD185_05950 [Sneathiella sp.]
MNDLLDGNSSENITLADIERGVREGHRLRNEEIRKQMGRANALVRKSFTTLSRFSKEAGTRLKVRLEAMALRQQQTRLYYD